MSVELLRVLRVCVLFVCVTFSAAAFAQARLSFDIPAQPARAAIRALAQQSGLQVAALTEDLSGIRTNAVRGVYAPLDALKLMIKDTGLELGLTDGSSVTIHRSDIQAERYP
jgi:hypothetical protein